MTVLAFSKLKILYVRDIGKEFSPQSCDYNQQVNMSKKIEFQIKDENERQFQLYV
jgi:hypothetical protein